MLYDTFKSLLHGNIKPFIVLLDILVWNLGHWEHMSLVHSTKLIGSFVFWRKNLNVREIPLQFGIGHMTRQNVMSFCIYIIPLLQAGQGIPSTPSHPHPDSPSAVIAQTQRRSKVLSQVM